VAEAMGVVDTAWSLGTCERQTAGLLARVFGSRAGVPQRTRCCSAAPCLSLLWRNLVNRSASRVCRSPMPSILLYSEGRAVSAASVGSESRESVHIPRSGRPELEVWRQAGWIKVSTPISHVVHASLTV
jgi:hypothetical protein